MKKYTSKKTINIAVGQDWKDVLIQLIIKNNIADLHSPENAELPTQSNNEEVMKECIEILEQKIEELDSVYDGMTDEEEYYYREKVANTEKEGLLSVKDDLELSQMREELESWG